MVEGRTARRSHSRKKGQTLPSRVEDAEGVRVDGAHMLVMA